MSKQIPITEVLLFIEADYESCVNSHLAWREKHNDGVTPEKNRREMLAMRSVVNAFHYISRDTEGFRAFCEAVRRKQGSMPGGGVVAKIDAILDEKKAAAE
jgi:hypothetical protein